MKFCESCLVKKTIQAGKKTEVCLYYAPPTRKPREPRRNVHDTRQHEKNRRTAIRKVERLILQNFTDKDRVAILTYRDTALLKKGMTQGLSADEEAKYMYKMAQKELSKFFDRLRRICKKEGVPLFYIAVTSDLDKDGDTPKRIHHHLIINFEAHSYIQDAWGDRGLVESKPIYPNHDKSPLAAYFLLQAHHSWGSRSYVASKNLKQPYVSCCLALSDALPPPPPDAFDIQNDSRRMSYYRP